MKCFAELYFTLEEVVQESDARLALKDYFRQVPAADAAWALYFLLGNRIKRICTPATLRQWVEEEFGYPEWLLRLSHDAAGDWNETLALVHPEVNASISLSLHQICSEYLLVLKGSDLEQQKATILQLWQGMNASQRSIFNAVATGSLRIAIDRRLVIQALSEAFHLEPALLGQRLQSEWEPEEEAFLRLTQHCDTEAEIQFFPWQPLRPLKKKLDKLGDPTNWQVEWQWDGIRVQIIVSCNGLCIRTDNDEILTDRFPELQSLFQNIRPGLILEGDILAWQEDRPLSVFSLQKRLESNSSFEPARCPVVFMASDIVEMDDCDIRMWPLQKRRALLEEWFNQNSSSFLRLSSILPAKDWKEVEAYRRQCRECSAEGIVLKQRDSLYGKGQWWSWKATPFTIDAVLVYAQKSQGRSAMPYSEYTLAVWNEDSLVPVAKTFLDLTDDENQRVLDFIRQNTVERFGPVCVVDPQLVFELAFDGLNPSKRHKAGLTMRLPKMTRWHKDKNPKDAGRLETLKQLLNR